MQATWLSHIRYKGLWHSWEQGHHESFLLAGRLTDVDCMTCHTEAESEQRMAYSAWNLDNQELWIPESGTKWKRNSWLYRASLANCISLVDESLLLSKEGWRMKGDGAYRMSISYHPIRRSALYPPDAWKEIIAPQKNEKNTDAAPLTKVNGEQIPWIWCMESW